MEDYKDYIEKRVVIFPKEFTFGSFVRYEFVHEAIKMAIVESNEKIINRLELLLQEKCISCGNIEKSGWKECGCHTEGINDGIKNAIALLKEK